MSESTFDNIPISETLLGIMNGTIESRFSTNPVQETKKSRKEVFDALFPMPENIKRRTSNKGVLDEFELKLERDYSKLVGKTPSEKNQEFVDRHTTDSFENKSGLEKRLKIYAVGLGIGATGLIILAPALGGNAPPDAISAYSNVTLGIGAVSLAAGIIDILHTLKIEAFSCAANFIQELVESNKNKKEQMELIFSLLDNYKSTDDPSLEFARRFLHNVDLSKNSRKVNYLILSGLANYRKAIIQNNLGLINDDEVEQAYGQMMYCFDSAMNNKSCSDRFRNDNRVNALIDDYCRRQQEVLSLANNPQKH